MNPNNGRFDILFDATRRIIHLTYPSKMYIRKILRYPKN